MADCHDDDKAQTVARATSAGLALALEPGHLPGFDENASLVDSVKYFVALILQEYQILTDDSANNFIDHIGTILTKSDNPVNTLKSGKAQLTRALVQYFVYRATQCNPDDDSACMTNLLDFMTLDFQPLQPGQFYRCMSSSWSDTGIRIVGGQRYEFFIIFTPPNAAAAGVKLSIDVSQYDIDKFGWIILHIFLSYVFGHLSQQQPISSLTQDNLLALLKPFETDTTMPNPIAEPQPTSEPAPINAPTNQPVNPGTPPPATHPHSGGSARTIRKRVAKPKAKANAKAKAKGASEKGKKASAAASKKRKLTK
jgi:hypothetical protein